MTDATQSTDTAEPTDEPTDDADTTPDDPEIDDDEMVDVAAIAEEVEAESADTDDESSTASTSDDDGADDDLDAPVDNRVTAGKVYTNGLGIAGATLRDRYGSLDGNRSDLADEYADLARDLEIDQAVDDWLEAQGGIDSLSPGQTVLISTLLWMGMVGMDDPEMVGNIVDDVGGDD